MDGTKSHKSMKMYLTLSLPFISPTPSCLPFFSPPPSLCLPLSLSLPLSLLTSLSLSPHSLYLPPSLSESLILFSESGVCVPLCSVCVCVGGERKSTRPH